jgi:hypothetical protein
VTKAQAKAYLRALCRKAEDGPTAINTANQKEIGGGDERTPRLQEAVMLIGPAEVAKIITSCEISRGKAALAKETKKAAAEARKKKVNAAKILKLQRGIKRCRELIERNEKALAGATTVASGYAAGVYGLRRRSRRARRTRRTRR